MRLHYLAWGDPAAQPVLLMHGGSAHAHWWDAFAASMASDYRVVAVDLRGHGDSGRPTPPAYLLDDYVADIAAFVEALGFSRVVLIGHSLGGLVAVVYASRASVPVEAVVVVDVSVRQSSGRRFLDRLRQWPHPVYSSAAEGVRRFRLLPSATAATPEMLAHVARHGLRDLPGGGSTPKFDRAALDDAAVRDVRAEFARLRCPILFVRGAKSTVASPAAIEEVRALAPHAHAAEVPGAYHHVMLDNPDGFENAVRGFLGNGRR